MEEAEWCVQHPYARGGQDGIMADFKSVSLEEVGVVQLRF